MARRLVFEPWDSKEQASLNKFVNLYYSFTGTTDNPNRAKTIEETRVALQILDALDKVSSIAEENGAPMRLLNKEGGTVELTDDAHRLLQRAVDGYIGTLPFGMARAGMAVKNFVDQAPVV